MSDHPDQEIVSRKHGEGNEWTFGEHFRLTIDVPILWRNERHFGGNVYIDPQYLPPVTGTDKTKLHRARLEDLFPFIIKALENEHEFWLDYAPDGRSGTSGYLSLPPTFAKQLYTYLWRYDDSHVSQEAR